LEQRRQYVLFFVLVAVVVATGFALGRSRARDAGVLTAVPRDAWLVVSVDVAGLRQSPLAQPLLGPGASAAVPGLGSLSGTCGFDPLTRLRELAVTSPEGGERGDFGVAFAGDLTRDELAGCADKVIRARGGQPATSAHGGFTVVEDTADARHARVAYRDGGPFLVGRGGWLDAMIDAAEGKAERARAEHAALRDALAPKAGIAARTLVLTALLPASLRERLKRDLGPELGSEGEKTYASVLAVSAAGVALSTGPSGSTTELVAELRCETPAACEEVKQLIERKRLAFSRDIGVRLIGLGPLLDSLAVEAHGASLSASARAGTDDLAKAIQRVIDYKTPRPATPPPPAPTPTPAPTPAPSAT
jgi:hypothetical protein